MYDGARSCDACAILSGSAGIQGLDGELDEVIGSEHAGRLRTCAEVRVDCRRSCVTNHKHGLGL